MTEFRTTALRSRTLIFAAFVACAFLGIVGRLGYLQVLKHDEYSRLAEAQRAKTVPLRPKRGPIVDRTGLVLAESSVAESLFGLPARMSDTARVASALAPILEEPAADIARRLDPDKRFVWVKRKLPPRTAQAVQDLHEPTLGFIQESLRLYPNRELAAHVVGFEGLDGKGLSGIEQAWDVHLAGAEGKALVERDALGRDVTGAPIVLKPSVPGQGVALTIDATLQYLAEKEVDAAWRRTRAKGAMAVMMDPRTGEILAMAIRPTFNPNAFGAATDEERRNRAITDPFEPGSTFKVIMAAGALDEGVVRPTDRFYGENGKIKIATAVIGDWKPFGWLTFSEVLQNSSNVGSIKAGLQLGQERYYKYITGFGFGQPVGLGLPGESRGQLRPPPPVVGPVAGHHVDRPGDLGDGRADGHGLRGHRQWRTPHAAADRARPPGRPWTRGPRLRAQGRPPGHLPRHGARAHDHPHGRGPRGHRTQCRHPRLRGRRQDRHRPEDGSEHPPLLARSGHPLLRGLRSRG